MKKVLLLPTILFPYVFCTAVGSYFISPNSASVIIPVLSIILLFTLLLSLVCNIIFMAKTKTANELLKAALVIKLLHIPTFILIFVFGIILGFMFFMTLPLILFLVVIDLITLFLSGMISVYAYIKALNEVHSYSTSVLIISLICQFFFCADVISLFVTNILVKKKSTT